MKSYILPRGGFEREVFRKHDIKPPQPMTTDILHRYLTSVVEHCPACIDNPVMLREKRLYRTRLVGRGVSLVHDGDTDYPTRTTRELIRYLEKASKGIFRATKHVPVKIVDKELVNANVIGDRVVLMTFDDLLEERSVKDWPLVLQSRWVNNEWSNNE